jgi:hypothetical protein
MYNIVAIDPSLISTALVVSNSTEFKMFNYCRQSSAEGKSGLKKWFKLAEEFITYRYIEYGEYDNYSDGEITKLKDYDRITDLIIEDILKNINPNLKTKVGTEGFSFSSSAGDIIDLVTFSTLLRKKLLTQVSEDVTILSPSTLKLEACKLSYPPIDVGKKKPKLEWRNSIGISGGNFTKREICLSITENPVWIDRWTKHLKENSSDLLGISTIPKPYEDANDAFIIFRYLEKNCLVD